MRARTTWAMVGSTALWACAGATPTRTPTGTATSTSTAAATPTATATATSIPEDAIPTLRLPGDVHPLAESIDLQLDPSATAYGGAVDIDVKLDAPRSTVWLHGKDFTVTRASLTPEGAAPIDAKWAERHESGVASLSLVSPAPAGKARIHVEFTAPFQRGGHGLYRASEDKTDYVFTQFEAIAARQAFPCFDEPSFKIPFTVSIVTPDAMTAVANTREASRAPERAGWTRFAFAPTQPLPSYLVAFAVGPFDVVPASDVPADGVRTRPLPLRAITPRGRGKDVAYALSHTGEILSLLEKYTGIEYPWDKLDIVAVPGKGGAMENAGLVTFGEQLVLMDPATAPVSQRRAYAGVMAHELAHQWTGDLVTMSWWDDTWLNEAFATWLAAKIVESFDPKMHAELGLLRGGLRAMSVDSLASARAIRQPITSTHDIENAFDTITYSKGGAVLDMFERWVGADAWQKGLHAHLEAHRFGNATADDFLQAENDASGRDVKSAFHTFLDQPGVPLVTVSEDCASWDPKRGLGLHQNRFVPLGSKADPGASWQVPVCVRAGEGVHCTLMADRDAFIPLPREGGCPAYLFPNVDGAGYYRFALSNAELQSLRTRGMGKLSDREKLVYGGSLRAAWSGGTTPMKDVMLAVEPLARDPLPAIAEEPMGYVSVARDWLWSDPLRARRALRARALRRRGGAPRVGAEEGRGRRDASAARVGALVPGHDRAGSRGTRRGEEAGTRVREGRRGAPGSGGPEPRGHGALGGRRGGRPRHVGRAARPPRQDAGRGRPRAPGACPVGRARSRARCRGARDDPGPVPARHRGARAALRADRSPRHARRGVGLDEGALRRRPRAHAAPPRGRAARRRRRPLLRRRPRQGRGGVLHSEDREHRGRPPRPGRDGGRRSPLHRPPHGERVQRTRLLRITLERIRQFTPDARRTPIVARVRRTSRVSQDTP